MPSGLYAVRFICRQVYGRRHDLEQRVIFSRECRQIEEIDGRHRSGRYAVAGD